MRDTFELITQWCALLIALIAGVHETYAQTANTATINMSFEQKVPGWMNETNVPNAADLLLTTVEDYGKFAFTVLKGKGLSKAVFADMVRPQAFSFNLRGGP